MSQYTGSAALERLWRDEAGRQTADAAGPFWAALEGNLADADALAGARLRFADWLEENGDETMGAVQRWLAATGKRPSQLMYAASPWYWFRDDVSDYRRVFALPSRLFLRLPGRDDRAWRIWQGLVPQWEVGYPTLRAAETALAVAWAVATAPRPWWAFWRRAWVPDYMPIRDPGDV